MSEYSLWKDWTEGDFGNSTVGDYAYFSKLFRLASVNVKGKKILEIGFGNGRLMSLLTEMKCENIIGVEQIEQLVNRAKESSYEAYCGSLHDIKELDNIEFDIIIAVDVLEHLEYEELSKLFDWIKSHLSESGKFIARFPEGSSPLGLYNQNGDFTHRTALTKTKLDFLVNQSNLKVSMYFDDYLYSNTLSRLKLLGKIVFSLISLYSYVLKLILKIVFYPLSPSLKWTVNSITIIENR